MQIEENIYIIYVIKTIHHLQENTQKKSYGKNKNNIVLYRNA